MMKMSKQRKKQMWDLWSLTDGEMGEEPPKEVMDEWR